MMRVGSMQVYRVYRGRKRSIGSGREGLYRAAHRCILVTLLGVQFQGCFRCGFVYNKALYHGILYRLLHKLP